MQKNSDLHAGNGIARQTLPNCPNSYEPILFASVLNKTFIINGPSKLTNRKFKSIQINYLELL